MSTTFPFGIIVQGDGTAISQECVLQDTTNTAVAPQKTLRANGTNGNLEILNAAQTDVVASLSDVGGLSYANVFDATCYGLVATTSPATTAQQITNTTAMNTALSDCAAAGGGVVLVPAGNYYINDVITVPSVAASPSGAGIAVVGQTAGTTFNQTATKDTFDILNSTGTRFDYINVNYTSLITGHHVAYNMKGVRNIQFNNVRSNNSPIGWYIFGCADIFLNGCGSSHASNNTAAMWIDGGGSMYGNNIGVIVVQSQFGGTTGSAILLGGAATTEFIICKFSGFDDGIEIGNALVANNSDRGSTVLATTELSLLECHFNTGMGSNGIWVHPPAGWTVTDIRVDDCHIQTHGDGMLFTKDTAGAGSFGSIDGVLINGGAFTFNAGGSGLHIQAGTNYVISGAVFAANSVAGIFIDQTLSPAVSDVLIVGCGCQATSGSGGSQVAGISLAGGPTRVRIIGCNLHGNTDPLQILLGFSGQASVVDCGSYNDTAINLTSFFTPVSGSAFNAGSFFYYGPIEVYVSGGTVTHIAVEANAAEVNTGLTSGAFTLAPQHNMRVTWTAAPTFLVVGT